MTQLTRRQFLKAAGKALGAGALATALGCGDGSLMGLDDIVTDYLHMAVDHRDNIDLSEHGLSSNQKAIQVHAPVEDSFDLGNGVQTNELWYTMDGDVVGVFYRDVEQVPDTVHLKSGDYQEFKVNYKGSTLKCEMENFGPVIEVRVLGDNERLVSSFDISNLGGNKEINSLGSLLREAEPMEVSWFDHSTGEHHQIGTSLEDVVVNSGVVVIYPKRNGEEDQVRLKIPEGLGNLARDYLQVIIEHDSTDLSDHGLSSAEKVVHIHASGDNRFDLGGVKTSELYIASTIDGIKTFYKDPEQIPDIQHYEDMVGGMTDLGSIVFKGNSVKLDVNYAVAPSLLNVLVNYGNDEHLNAQFNCDPEVVSLGHYASLEEPQEVVWHEKATDTSHLIGLSAKDVVMNCGIRVKRPVFYGAEDKVFIEVPEQ